MSNNYLKLPKPISLIGLFLLFLFLNINSFSQTVLFNADFENTSGDNSWTFADADNADNNGDFIINSPTPYTSNGTQMELEDTVGATGSQTLHTGLGNNDVDGGPVSAQSINIPIPNTASSAAISFYWFFAHAANGDSDDFFRVQIRNNSNTVLATIINEIGTNSGRDANWSQVNSFDLSPYIGQTIHIYISSEDGGSGGKVEAAVDDIILTTIDSPPLDTDGDTVPNSVDIDDDNDGILDIDENCILPGGAEPASDAITPWDQGAYKMHVVGNNFNGLGYQESGFQKQAFLWGINLTHLNGNDFTSLPNRQNPQDNGQPGSDGTATSTTGTFDGTVVNGTLRYTSNVADVTGTGSRRSQFRRITSNEFISGNTGDAVLIKPPINLTPSEHYTVHIGFTPAVTAFSFDFNDIFDTFNDNSNVIAKYEVFADGLLLMYFETVYLGNNLNAALNVFDANGNSRGTVVAGGNGTNDGLEATIGFITQNLADAISEVTIRHTLRGGNMIDGRADLHSIDGFTYSAGSRTCFSPDPDFDDDGIHNDLDLDSDNDGIPDIIEAQTTIDYITLSGVDVDMDGLDDAFDADTTTADRDLSIGIATENTDGNSDGADYVDVDADDDGIFDINEAHISITLNDPDNDGMANNPVGTNGFINSLEAGDNYTDVNGGFDDTQYDNFLDTDETPGDAQTVGDVDYRDTHASGTPIISQVYQQGGNNRYVEITNIHPTNPILANTLKIGSYKNEAFGSLTNEIPDDMIFVASEIAPGQSVIVKRSSSNLTTGGGAIVINDNQIVDIVGGDDIVFLTHPKGLSDGTTAWKNRYDSGHSFNNTTSYVRHDDVDTNYLDSNGIVKDYDTTQWTAFVDANTANIPANIINGASPTQQRSEYDPIITEVAAPANENANVYLGIHYSGNTLSSDNFTNGTPDKSRTVEINSDLTRTTLLNARNLQVNTNRNLTLDATYAVITTNLINNGTIVLEDNIASVIKTPGQLIQTKRGDNTNAGSGNIFINQTSSIANEESIYRYTYWSSPVAAANDAKIYTVGSVMKDPSSTPSNIVNINFTESSYDGAPGTPVTIADYWIWSYMNGVDNSGFEHRRDNGNIPVGSGYLMKGSGNAAGQDFTFVGKPNNGDIVSSHAPDANPTSLENIKGNSNNIVGNPYPSSLDALQFIYDNSTVIKNGTLYFWQHVGEADATSTVTAGHTQSGYRGGYATINYTMAVNGANINGLNSSTGSGYTYNIPGRYIPVGQGFLFTSQNYTGNRPITFSNWQRVYQNETLTGLTSGDYGVGSGNDSHFLGRGTSNKKNNSVARNQNNQFPTLRLGFEHNNENNVNLHRQLGIGFIEGLTFENNYGYDSPMYDSQLTEIYWKFPSDDTRYLIAGVQELSEDLEVPIDVVIGEDEPVTFMVDGKRNIDYPIFLYDAVDQISYNLTNPTEITLPTGTYTDRFFVTFKAQGTVLNTANQLANETTIFFDKNSDEIVIKTINSLEIKKAELFNLLGQSISNWKDISLNSSEKRLKVNKLSTSVYILNLLTDKGKISKKLVIE